eukprot:s4099_g1.t1
MDVPRRSTKQQVITSQAGALRSGPRRCCFGTLRKHLFTSRSENFWWMQLEAGRGCLARSEIPKFLCSQRHPSGLPTLLDPVPKHSKEPSDPKGAKDVKAQKSENVDQVEVSCHASAGAKWHLELLAVSTELKQKLQDPQFVATRCDLDGSGDLDAHELTQAARVYGISQGSSSGDQDDQADLQLLMAGQQRISKENFAEMVVSRQGSTKLMRAFDSNTVKVLLGGT